MDLTKTLADMLAMAPNLLYATCDIETDFRIEIATNDKPERSVTRFAVAYDCFETWENLTEIMTTNCVPRCVQFQQTFFQPKFVRSISVCEDERAFFVTLEFGNKRNLSYGFKTRDGQKNMYAYFLALFADRLDDNDSPFPSVQ